MGQVVGWRVDGALKLKPGSRDRPWPPPRARQPGDGRLTTSQNEKQNSSTAENTPDQVAVQAASQLELRRAESALAPGPRGTTADRPKMRLVAWRPLRKNSLRGFATVVLPAGLKIFDIPVLCSHEKCWAALPSKPQLDKEGRHKRDANGKPAYSPVLEWRDKQLSDRFSAAVVELIHAAHPGDLDAGDAS